MKKTLCIIALAAVAHLYVGYYISQDMEDPRLMIFIKKYPTLKMRFENIYTSDRYRRPRSELSDTEWQALKDYCKYRLGINTPPFTQEEVDACSVR